MRSIFSQCALHVRARLKHKLPCMLHYYHIVLSRGACQVSGWTWAHFTEVFSTLVSFQALAHSSGYDSTDEEDPGLEPHTRGHTGLRGARSEEFLDRRSPERRPGPSHRSVKRNICWPENILWQMVSHVHSVGKVANCESSGEWESHDVSLDRIVRAS